MSPNKRQYINYKLLFLKLAEEFQKKLKTESQLLKRWKSVTSSFSISKHWRKLDKSFKILCE